MNSYRVFMMPKQLNSNKYNELLSREIESKGIFVSDITPRCFYKIKKNDVLHLHWPSFNYRSKNLVITIIRSIVFCLLISLLKMRGVIIVWSVHNIWPHSTGKTKLDKWIRTYIARMCNRLIIMGESVKEEVSSTFRVSKEKIDVIKHGHYKDVYIQKGIKVRDQFNIPDEHYVYAFIGQISPYKGINELIDAFNKMKDPNVHLVIAGKVTPDFDMNIFQCEHLNPQIHTFLKFIDDDEMFDYMNAVDAVVLPYKNITTSGTAILALSCYKPIVAPKIGLMEDYSSENCAILYDPDSPNGLFTAMETIREEKERFNDRKGFDIQLQQMDWSNIADKTIAIYSMKGEKNESNGSHLYL